MDRLLSCVELRVLRRQHLEGGMDFGAVSVTSGGGEPPDGALASISSASGVLGGM